MADSEARADLVCRLEVEPEGGGRGTARRRHEKASTAAVATAGAQRAPDRGRAGAVATASIRSSQAEVMSSPSTTTVATPAVIKMLQGELDAAEDKDVVIQ